MPNITEPNRTRKPNITEPSRSKQPDLTEPSRSGKPRSTGTEKLVLHIVPIEYVAKNKTATINLIAEDG